MECDRFDKLTEAQRECLRLVFAHKSSKEIAIELGKSPFTIDKRIERAIRTLGVANRIEAARLLDQHERARSYEQFVCEPDELVVPDVPAIMSPSQMVEGPSGGRVRDRAMIGRDVPDDWREPRRRSLTWPLPTRGDARNGLTTTERIIWIVIGTLVVIVALFLALAGAESLQRTLWGLASRAN